MGLAHAHQETNITQLNRYPALYAGASAMAAVLHGRSPIRILVLGCSTGQEPYTLADHYFRKASHRIDAGDISESAVANAVQHFSHPRISYFHATADQALPSNTCYQVIFANSLFCRWPESRGEANIAKIYPFSAFERAVYEIDEVLVSGGMLSIYNANYRLGDTGLATHYYPLRVPGLNESGFVTKFDPDGQVSADQSYPYALFLKVADA